MSTELTFLKSMYWILFTLGHLYIVYNLFVMDRAIAATIWAVVGFILIIVFYHVFFPPGTGNQWPPYFTACPDYLTQVQPGKCMDFVGLGSPLLKRADRKDPQVNDPNYTFNTTGLSTSDKIALAQQYNLTWDGLT
jgi:hypothetical protein